jgi:hypothetical protein
MQGSAMMYAIGHLHAWTLSAFKKRACCCA